MDYAYCELFPTLTMLSLSVKGAFLTFKLINNNLDLINSSAYTETTKQSATTVAGLESKKAIATNGSNVTQKKNDNGEVVSKQTAGTNQDNNSSNNSITNTTNDSNNTNSNKPLGSETENNKTKSISSAYSGQYHTVKPGQTLYDISMSYYGTSEMVDEIKDRNNIDDDYTIKEGQKILLP